MDLAKLPRRLWERFEHLVVELAKFGTVGSVAFVVDVVLSNVLRFGVGLGPLTSKAISVAVSATVAFCGNRFWTFRHRKRQGIGKEYVLYFGLNAVGLLIALAVVGFTFYVLKLDGPIAYNISANVIGLGLGTLFRFWSYKRWVFPAISGAAGRPTHRPADTRSGRRVQPAVARRPAGNAGHERES